MHRMIVDEAKEEDLDLNIGKFKSQFGDLNEQKRLREESPTNTNMRASFLL